MHKRVTVGPNAKRTQYTKVSSHTLKTYLAYFGFKNLKVLNPRKFQNESFLSIVPRDKTIGYESLKDIKRGSKGTSSKFLKYF